MTSAADQQTNQVERIPSGIAFPGHIANSAADIEIHHHVRRGARRANAVACLVDAIVSAASKIQPSAFGSATVAPLHEFSRSRYITPQGHSAAKTVAPERITRMGDTAVGSVWRST